MLVEQYGATQSTDTGGTRVLAVARRIGVRGTAGAVPRHNHCNSPKKAGDDDNAEGRGVYLR